MIARQNQANNIYQNKVKKSNKKWLINMFMANSKQKKEKMNIYIYIYSGKIN